MMADRSYLAMPWFVGPLLQLLSLGSTAQMIFQERLELVLFLWSRSLLRRGLPSRLFGANSPKCRVLLVDLDCCNLTLNSRGIFSQEAKPLEPLPAGLVLAHGHSKTYSQPVQLEIEPLRASWSVLGLSLGWLLSRRKPNR